MPVFMSIKMSISNMCRHILKFIRLPLSSCCRISTAMSAICMDMCLYKFQTWNVSGPQGTAMLYEWHLPYPADCCQAGLLFKGGGTQAIKYDTTLTQKTCPDCVLVMTCFSLPSFSGTLPWLVQGRHMVFVYHTPHQLQPGKLQTTSSISVVQDHIGTLWRNFWFIATLVIGLYHAQRMQQAAQMWGAFLDAVYTVLPLFMSRWLGALTLWTDIYILKPLQPLQKVHCLWWRGRVIRRDLLKPPLTT